MTEQIVEVENLKSGSIRPDFEAINLSTCLETVVKAHQTIAESKGVALQLLLPDNSLFINSDADIVQKILNNLVSNAIKASPPEKVVEIRASADEKEITISVTDFGPGIDPALADDLLHKPVKSKIGKGLGIGLFLSNQYAELLNGRLSHRNRAENSGMEFSLFLPF